MICEKSTNGCHCQGSLLGTLCKSTCHCQSTDTVLLLASSSLIVILSGLSGDIYSTVVECWTHGQNVTGSMSDRNGRRNFLSELTFCASSYFSICSAPVLPWQHVKDSSHSAKSAGGRLHLNMHTLFNQQSRRGLTMLSRHCVGHSSGNTRPQSSKLAGPLWTDPGLKCLTGMRELISN